jgi:hypothetical protein
VAIAAASSLRRTPGPEEPSEIRFELEPLPEVAPEAGAAAGAGDEVIEMEDTATAQTGSAEK